MPWSNWSTASLGYQDRDGYDEGFPAPLLFLLHCLVFLAFFIFVYLLITTAGSRELPLWDRMDIAHTQVFLIRDITSITP